VYCRKRAGNIRITRDNVLEINKTNIVDIRHYKLLHYAMPQIILLSAPAAHLLIIAILTPLLITSLLSIT